MITTRLIRRIRADGIINCH
uniref:Uncharacterized protein n=1 Tax=Arundo donax TaxID=35708 RepID=A0A0A9BWM6_ARUDO